MPIPWPNDCRRTASPARSSRWTPRWAAAGACPSSNSPTGSEISFGGKYLELVPRERISYISIFDDKNLPGEMETTITLKAVSAGVEINIVQEGIPAVIPADKCYVGWQQSLMLLEQLVEAEIKE